MGSDTNDTNEGCLELKQLADEAAQQIGRECVWAHEDRVVKTEARGVLDADGASVIIADAMRKVLIEKDKAYAVLIEMGNQTVERCSDRILELEVWKKSAVESHVKYMCSCSAGTGDCPLGRKVGEDRCTADELRDMLRETMERL